MRLSTSAESIFSPTDQFMARHIGSQGKDKQAMLDTVGYATLDELMDVTIPNSIKLPRPLSMGPPMSESEALAHLKKVMSKNIVNKSFIGMGYYETLCPGVILRNVLENPGWYTSYTPYQAEIAQGRLTSLLNFQTMIADLTGMPLSNSSLLDEATAAAEAMSMCYSLNLQKKKKFFVDVNCHPQNIALVQTRGTALGLTVEVGDVHSNDLDMTPGTYCGVLVQYPDTYGGFGDWSEFTALAHSHGTMVVAATDLMASVLLKPAGEMGFDIAVGSAQRFGVPMGFGGPHAAFLATTDAYSRKMPARIIGVSQDCRGKPALRMAMQTREQHIRRDKATSNICTAQALLANMAAFYGVYHGPVGLTAIAKRINGMTAVTAKALTAAGYKVVNDGTFFDTLVVDVSSKGVTGQQIQDRAAALGCNVRIISSLYVGISFGEAITKKDTLDLLAAFGVTDIPSSIEEDESGIPEDMARTSAFMTHPNFNTYHSETQMLRYLKSLEDMDLALNYSMISLGSCTMKLNASVEMFPVTWPETANMHPFCPPDQALGYKEMNESLNRDLAEITGFAAVSSQPNSGAQGEYAGLLAIKGYQQSRGHGHRNICLIPVSAHGTNPASASMVGYKVVVVKSDGGIIDVKDLKEKAEKHKDDLAALMVTYPSTYGVFEEAIKEITDCIHGHGGQVYMDGANMNAQVALTSPGYIGADVCHLNLHKTFCIPHGGGGPGVGSIGVAKHLAPFLPGHPVIPCSGEGEGVSIKTGGTVSAAPFGSAAILPISWMYIKMLGEAGLKEATGMAILNANYMAKRLEEGYSVVYKGVNGTNAHEFILDLRPFKEYGIVEEDVAKRLQDYGFHSPTMSWPVPGTLMIEPTESEDKAQMDLFCDAMLSIRKEIEDIVQGNVKMEESALHRAPHTMDMVYADEWNRPYTRKEAAFPGHWINEKNKFWPTVGRIDNVYGDRNLVCTCPPIEVYEEVTV
jgi:glycine dehydrogenase